MSSGSDSGGSVTGPVRRVAVVCSHGGHILQGTTRLMFIGYVEDVEVERDISYPDIISRLSNLYSLADGRRVLKYQLPGVDLDALVPVANDHDLELMMQQYDDVTALRESPPPLRLYLDPPPVSLTASPPVEEEPYFDQVIFDDGKHKYVQRSWHATTANPTPTPDAQPAKDDEDAPGSS